MVSYLRALALQLLIKLTRHLTTRLRRRTRVPRAGYRGVMTLEREYESFGNI